MKKFRACKNMEGRELAYSTKLTNADRTRYVRFDSLMDYSISQLKKLLIGRDKEDSDAIKQIIKLKKDELHKDKTP